LHSLEPDYTALLAVTDPSDSLKETKKTSEQTFKGKLSLKIILMCLKFWGQEPGVKL